MSGGDASGRLMGFETFGYWWLDGRWWKTTLTNTGKVKLDQEREITRINGREREDIKKEKRQIIFVLLSLVVFFCAPSTFSLLPVLNSNKCFFVLILSLCPPLLPKDA